MRNLFPVPERSLCAETGIQAPITHNLQAPPPAEAAVRPRALGEESLRSPASSLAEGPLRILRGEMTDADRSKVNEGRGKKTSIGGEGGLSGRPRNPANPLGRCTHWLDGTRPPRGYQQPPAPPFPRSRASRLPGRSWKQEADPPATCGRDVATTPSRTVTPPTRAN